MTLQDLLKAQGITSITKFRELVGWKPQHTWNLWHGYSLPGMKQAQQIHTTCGVPMGPMLLLRLTAPPYERKRQPA